METFRVLAQMVYENRYADRDADLFGRAFLLFWFVLVVVLVAGVWKMFKKAGQPGWAALVPIYNSYVLLKIAGRPGWWLLLYLIPLVNVIISIIVALDIAKAFGKNEIFGVVALWLFSVIGYLILGFGEDKYSGPRQTQQVA